MSTISTIYDSVQSAVVALFPNKLELSDPIDIQNNDNLSLTDGYAVQIGVASNTNRELCNVYSLQRDIIITISKIVPGGHKSFSIYDTTTKSLLEELHLLIQTINSNAAIRNSCSVIDWISDSGIEKFNGESSQFLIIRATFRLEYFESLS